MGRQQPVHTRSYTGAHLDRVAFPLGGMGAGMICLEGTGALSHVSLRHRPEMANEPCMFTALHVPGMQPAARVLEAPVPTWKVFGVGRSGAANGAPGTSYGLPRFASGSFSARFPFATVSLADERVPLSVAVTGWSPFEPGDADHASLPVAALEYHFTNGSNDHVTAVLSHHAFNFLALATEEGRPAVSAVPGGFVLCEAAPPDRPADAAAWCACVDGDDARVDCAWFRGGWWDALSMVWQHVASGRATERPGHASGRPSPGASIYVPFTVAPGATRTIVLRFSWFVGASALRFGPDQAGAHDCAEGAAYRPWYAGRFTDGAAVATFWRDHYEALRARTQRFSDCFHDTTLPAEVVEAVAANLTILKSPTALRQDDGRLWGWEGCRDDAGCCAGSCTHVWNYAQAVAHLFPDLERSLRETEFQVSQDDAGHQAFRSSLPIRATEHTFHAAADGQLGGVMKVYRDWRICGDTEWLRRLWPKVRAGLDYCIATWDPGRRGIVERPHHNTYDVEFWGPDGMCTSFYLGALRAAELMGAALDDDVSAYRELRTRGTACTETQLFNGAYFIQQVEWGDGQAAGSGRDPDPSAEELQRFGREGPKYQYGHGCLSDGVLGAWMAAVCGVGEILDPAKVRSHLASVHRHNLKPDLSDHANPQRPGYALGTEGGLLLCTWPRGGRPSLPFVYSDEVWTGIEYQVASHLMLTGRVAEGLAIVRTCRARYDGRVRNPFDEYECGHWYARAMASYALLQGLTGARYDAVEEVLYLEPSIAGDFRSFFAAAGGYGTVGVRGGEPFLDVVAGAIPVRTIAYRPARGSGAGP